MKILLVEDHAPLAKMSCMLLREIHGHKVDHARSGEEALRLAEIFSPDLMLIDINLPDTDGYELAARFRKEPRFQNTILVALTGWGSFADESRVQTAAFDAHFKKPMDFALLPTLARCYRSK